VRVGERLCVQAGALGFAHRWALRLDSLHLDAEAPKHVQTMDRHNPWVEVHPETREEILRAIDVCQFIR